MKKFLIGLALLVVSISLVLWFVVRYRDAESQMAVVHQKSTAIVQISVDQLGLSVAKNAILHPFAYVKEDTVKKEKSDQPSYSKLWRTGWSIPAKLFFFSMPDDPLSFFCVQSIANVEQFKNFIRSNFSIPMDSTHNGSQLWFATSKEKNISVLALDKQFVIAVGVRDNNRQTQMLKLLQNQEKQLIPINKLDKFDLTTDADIYYSNLEDKSTLHLGMEGGKFTVNGNMYSKLWQGSANPKARQLPKDNKVNMWLHADISPLFSKYRPLLEKYNIPGDSLQRYYGGYIDLQWKAADVPQQDSIIAYVMDENFEMQETVELRKEWVPNIELTVKASPHLATYLPEKLFYKFQKQTVGDLTSLHTAEQNQFDPAMNDSPYYFYLSISNLATDKRINNWLPVLKLVEHIQIGAQNTEANRSQITAEIQLKNAKIHALYQFMHSQ